MIDYHASPAIGRSELLCAHRSWNEFYLRCETRSAPVGREPSAAVLRGTVSHALLFSPAVLGGFVPIPKAVLSKAGRRQGRAWDAFVAECKANGKTPVPMEMLSVVACIAARVQEATHELRAAAVQAAYETPVYVEHESGLLLKARPDELLIFPSGDAVILDLKVVESLSKGAFVAHSRKYGYWLQDVHYCECVSRALQRPVNQFFFVLVESSIPHRVRVRAFYAEAREAFAARREWLLNEIVRRRAENDWSEPDEDVVEYLHHNLEE